MINLAYQYKLKLSRHQEREIDAILDTCKSVYNYALTERKHWIKSKKCAVNACSIVSEYIIPTDAAYPNYYLQAKNLTEAKKSYPALKEAPSQVLQQTLKTLDKAFSDMRDRGFGFPRFKKRMKSFVFPQLKPDCLATGKVKLPKLGWVRLRQSREYPLGFTPKQVRVVKKASGYYLMIAFQSQEDCPDNPVGKTSVGIDAGIESFIATSLGELIKSPRFLFDAQRKLKLLQRRLKHKIKGSNNWLRLQKKIGRLHEKVGLTRRDWHFKLAHYLCDLADNIFVEDINFKSWQKGLFGKQIGNSGIGGFINEILPFVCGKRGNFDLKVDKDGTSQECSNCHQHTGKKELSQRIHRCQHCGYTAPRDVVSAEVIEYRGLTAVGHTVVKNQTLITRINP